MRMGYTTGACAAAAAKAAAMMLFLKQAVDSVQVQLPGGNLSTLPVADLRSLSDRVEAVVRKDSGDDPDITNRADILVRIEEIASPEVKIMAGAGVGTVTKPGLAIAPGEPAINPVPRMMITDAIREICNTGVLATVFIPGGEQLALRTCNPRLGILGGLSILGTTGRVRPFSTEALLQTIKCSFNVAKAAGIGSPVLVPGHLGERSARKHLICAPEQIIEVGNAWGFALDQLQRRSINRVLLLGHPGKLAKLAAGYTDTHSSNSPSAVHWLQQFLAGMKPYVSEPVVTVEALFQLLPKDTRIKAGNRVALAICQAVEKRFKGEAAIVLVDIHGQILGCSGDYKAWM